MIDTRSHIIYLLIPWQLRVELRPLSFFFLSTLGVTGLTKILIVVSALLLVGCSGAQTAQPILVEPDPTQARVKVVATLPVLADLAKNVGGSLVEVSTVVPAGADPHSYQSTPSDSVMISHAHLLITNGSGLDDFILPVLKNARATHSIHVVASDGLENQMPHDEKDDPHTQASHGHHGEEGDPHFWFDPSLAARYVDAILDGLIRSDSENAKHYREQAEIYTARLKKLDREIATILNQVVSERVIVINH